MKKQKGNSSGIGIFGVMFIVLFTLKILGIAPVAAWSWWIVTMPLWGGFVFVVGIVLCFALFAAWIETK